MLKVRKKGRRKRDDRHLPPHVAIAGLARSHPGFFVPVEVTRAAARALMVVKRYGIERKWVLTPEHKDALRARLVEIADQYFHSRANHKGLVRWPQIRRKTKPIANAVETLRTALEQMPNEARLAFASRPASEGRSLQNLKDELDDLAARCRSILEPVSAEDATFKRHMVGKAGRPSGNYLTPAVTQLSQLWTELDGRPFSGTFTVAAGKVSSGETQFGEAGPQFILAVLQAIDSTVEIGSVRAVLKEAAAAN